MNSLKKLSFKVKLMVLVGLLSLVSTLIGYEAYSGLGQVISSYDRVTDKVMPSNELSNQMFLAFRDIRINLRSLGLQGLSEEETQEFISRVGAAIDQYEKHNAAYQKLIQSDEEKMLYSDVQKEWTDFKNIGGAILALQKSGNPQDKVKMHEIFLKDCPDAAAKYLAAFTKLEAFNFKNGSSFIHEAKSIGQQSNRLIMAWVIGGVCFGLIIGFLFANSIVNSISLVVRDLTHTAELVGAASEQIAAHSSQLSHATTGQAASLEETAASLSQISAMVAKSTDNANVSVQTSNACQTKAEAGRQAVDQMLSSMNEITSSNEAIMNQVNQSNVQMTEIIKVIREIGTKTKVINDIVFQTKLLSFNASVEAARAGEHGKGFAVVAEEVGKLAQMSGNAAKEISTMLEGSISKVEGIAHETKSKVQSLTELGKIKIDSGVSVAQQCSAVLNEIVHGVTNVSKLISDISNASIEQNLGVAEINKAMNHLDTATQQNAGTSHEAAQSAEELSQHAELLKASVRKLVNTIEGETTQLNAEAIPLGSAHQKTHVMHLDKIA